MQRPILLVDDDAHFRETLADAMSLEQMRVDTAVSGEEALRYLERMRPSLILLDVQLPDVDGFRLCRKLRAHASTRSVPIVFLSAKYTEPADRAEGLLMGADAYLSKPVSPDALREEIRYLLDRPK